MTGFGQGACQVGGRRLLVEIRAVNHRFFDLKLRLPWSDVVLEALLTAAVRQAVSRGALSVHIRDDNGAAPPLELNHDLARRHYDALEQLRARLGLEEPVSLALLLQMRDILGTGEGALHGEALFAAIEPGLRQALEALSQMREQEGATIAADLAQRRERVRVLCAEITDLAVQTPAQLQARLKDRLQRLEVREADPERLAQEIALVADRIDISEELQRLSCHLDQLSTIAAQGVIGRKIDFLLQEVGRELNTVAAKAQSAPIAHRVVEAKAELEKMREQAQNVE